MKSICNIVFPLHKRFSLSEALFLTIFKGQNYTFLENDPVPDAREEKTRKKGIQNQGWARNARIAKRVSKSRTNKI